MKILSFDPSGNWKEGKGTTGICIMETGKPTRLSELKASDYESDVEYWAAHEDLILLEFPTQIVCEGYKLYNHRGKSASIQANSELETPQLIGIIKLVAYRMNIPLQIQFASEVKNRWSDSVLTKLNYLDQRGSRFYFKGQLTNLHQRDSLRHCIHFKHYKLKE